MRRIIEAHLGPSMVYRRFEQPVLLTDDIHVYLILARQSILNLTSSDLLIEEIQQHCLASQKVDVESNNADLTDCHATSLSAIEPIPEPDQLIFYSHSWGPIFCDS